MNFLPIANFIGNVDGPFSTQMTKEIDYHRLLWQELNKNFGNETSTVFVMAVGQQLSYFDYDVCKNTKMAAYNTYQLVNSTIACGTNHNTAGSSISLMWERLLQGKGPGAGQKHRPAFEEAKETLYVEYPKRKNELYEKYLTKKNALEQKKVKMQDDCKKKYGNQWKANFEREFNGCIENNEFQDLKASVEHHLKAIEVWEHGPLFHILNPIKKGIAIATC